MRDLGLHRIEVHAASDMSCRPPKYPPMPLEPMTRIFIRWSPMGFLAACNHAISSARRTLASIDSFIT